MQKNENNANDLKTEQNNKKIKLPPVVRLPLKLADDIKLSLSNFSLEMQNKKQIKIRGCKKIAYYSPVRITLTLGSDNINICGRSLSCTAFSQSCVGIEGDIRCVFFSDRLPKGR